jgi:hypothetical protein
VRRTPGHRHHHDARRRSLEEYLASGLAQEMNNSQTRALVGMVEVPYGTNPPELLEQAKRNVEQWFSAVGLTERFDESLILFKQAFGWNKLHYVRANVASRREQPSDEAMRMIEEMNQLDIELYRWAEQRFQAIIDASPTFADDYARFRRTNSLYRPWGTVTYSWPKRVQARFAPRGHEVTVG